MRPQLGLYPRYGPTHLSQVDGVSQAVSQVGVGAAGLTATRSRDTRNLVA